MRIFSFCKLLPLIVVWGMALTGCCHGQAKKSQSHALIEGKVIHVCDGDTYDILFDGNRKKRVRMAGIDAPEKGQDFSKKATQYLKGLILGKQVVLDSVSSDQNGRIVGFTLLSDGQEASREMLRAGLAWHYKEFYDSDEFAQLEAEARAKPVGLWTDKYSVNPKHERALRKKGYKSVEIKQLKIQGLINTDEAVKAICPKNPHK